MPCYTSTLAVVCDGRVAQAFDLADISSAVGAPLLRSLQGRESGMHASSGFDHAATANQIAQAASPPTLAKNARMGHPLWEWCIQTFSKVGHPPPSASPV